MTDLILISDRSPKLPLTNAPSVINWGLSTFAKKKRWRFDFHPTQIASESLRHIPVQTSLRAAKKSKNTKRSFRIITEKALVNFHLERTVGCKTFLYLNGLKQSPGLYLRNPEIDHFLCNSVHAARVLESLALNLKFADQDFRSHPFSPISVVEPFLPCTSSVRGYKSLGEELVLPFRHQSSRVVIGHCIRAQKNDCFLLVGTVLALATTAAKEGKKLKFCVANMDMADLRRIATSMGEESSFDQIFVGLPHLKNRALMKLFRISDFGLAYNSDWESFGFYPLESVFYGCPMFTNGSGNLRHLLPKDCGIQARDNSDFYFGSRDARLQALRRSATQIWKDLKKVRAQCSRGRAIIKRKYHVDAFYKRLNDALVLTPSNSKVISEGAALAPWVRIFEPGTGRVVSDYQSLILPVHLRKVVAEICLQRKSWARKAPEKIHQLVQLGVLSYQRLPS